MERLLQVIASPRFGAVRVKCVPKTFAHLDARNCAHEKRNE
jgi:hypothetical protein